MVPPAGIILLSPTVAQYGLQQSSSSSSSSSMTPPCGSCSVRADGGRRRRGTAIMGSGAAGSAVRLLGRLQLPHQQPAPASC
jgi:hypothetical protein